MTDWKAIADQLAEAIRLTREYVGEKTLPAVSGWSWFDAMQAYHNACESPVQVSAGTGLAGGPPQIRIVQPVMCPEGCGCRLDGVHADRRECGCDGPCTQRLAEPPQIRQAGDESVGGPVGFITTAVLPDCGDPECDMPDHQYIERTHQAGCVYDGQPHHGDCRDQSPIRHGQCVRQAEWGGTGDHTHEGWPGWWKFPGES